jgi:hypothetical protein
MEFLYLENTSHKNSRLGIGDEKWAMFYSRCVNHTTQSAINNLTCHYSHLFRYTSAILTLIEGHMLLQ